MKRREFITLLGGAAAAWPLPALAQQPDRTRRIGVLMGYAESDLEVQAHIAAFREGLQKLGWTEGRNIQIDTRWAAPDDAASMRRFAKELVALQPDVILSNTTPTTTALLQQTPTIPIVFAIVADPIGSGFVASFARPGGNVTGFTFTEPTMAGKWLELLKEIAPRVVRIAMLFNPVSATYADYWLNPSEPPLRLLQWRQLPHRYAIRPSWNPSLPRRHRSQMVALLRGRIASRMLIA
jgi:putative ABC transport system substrate-binding protein